LYAKIFQSIYDGTLVENWQGLVTFEQMLILCDQDGMLDMTQYAISRRTGIPVEIINTGVEFLEQPDKDSRTPEADGRRIIRIDPDKNWGWKVVNYEKYREIRTAEDRREYMRNYMKERREKDKENQDACKPESLQVNSGKQELGELAPHTQAHSQTQVITPPAEVPPYQQIVQLYQTILPTCPKVAKLTDARKRHVRARWIDDLSSLDKWRNYFTYVSESAFLTGRKDGNNGRPPFLADFDWLIKQANVVKVAEGKYHRSE
jgi:hypothetical protein